MKKIIAFFCWFIIIVNHANSQSLQSNLEKYWIYRARLRNEYMLQVNSNTGLLGTNIPAERRYPKDLVWTDALWHMGHYIAVLATEYKLLQLNGQDCEPTRQELAYALLAIARLDMNAETSYGSTGILNGFMVRDDVPWYDSLGFAAHFPDTPKIDCAWSKDPPTVMSQDQIWSLFLGLAIVKKCVNDQWIQDEVYNLTLRTVNALHYCKEVAGNTTCVRTWAIHNPVTNHEYGYDDGSQTWALSYGFARAANSITGENCHYGNSNSSTYEKIFKKALASTLSNLLLYVFHTKEYNIAGPVMLAAVDNIQPLDNDYTLSECYRRYADHGYFIHMPLVYGILHKNFDAFESHQAQFYLNILNSAPINGPGSSQPHGWHSINRLSCPWNIAQGSNYNGLDYMLLHNLFLLCFVKENQIFTAFHGIDFTIPYRIDYVGRIKPVLVMAKNNVIMEHTNITNDGLCIVYAGNQIILRDGFTVNGGEFKAIYHPYLQNYYYKINSDYTEPMYKISINDSNINRLQKDSSIVKTGADNDDNLIISNSSNVAIHNQSDSKKEVYSNQIATIETDDIYVFPNPAKEFVYVQNIFISDYISKIEIFDVNYNLVDKIEKVNTSYTKINLSDLKKGLYLPKIKMHSGFETMKKIYKID